MIMNGPELIVNVTDVVVLGKDDNVFNSCLDTFRYFGIVKIVGVVKRVNVCSHGACR